MSMRTLLAALAGVIALGMSATLAQAEGPTAKAILAGGCFWCLEHDFRKLPGVVSAVSGYSGGDRPNPTYQNYNDESPGAPVPHVEVVEVTYDLSKLSYDKVLDYFYRHIDPTDGGGQFCDRGPAYAPVIYTANAAEKSAADTKTALVAQQLKMKIDVAVRDAKIFWPAEDYHQDYANKNPLKYKYYRFSCGRDRRVSEVWDGVTN